MNIADYLKNEDLVEDLAKKFGFHFDGLWSDEPIPCPLVGVHQGKLAGFQDADDGRILLSVFHVKSGKSTWTLPELYANLKSGGRVKSLDTPGIRRIWLVRMLYELGRIKLDGVNYHPLPEDAPAKAKEVYNGFILAVRCHLHGEDGDNRTTFAYDFASGWCNVCERTIRKYRHWLCRRGYIVDTGQQEGQVKLYRLGTATVYGDESGKSPDIQWSGKPSPLTKDEEQALIESIRID